MSSRSLFAHSSPWEEKAEEAEEEDKKEEWEPRRETGITIYLSAYLTAGEN